MKEEKRSRNAVDEVHTGREQEARGDSKSLPDVWAAVLWSNLTSNLPTSGGNDPSGFSKVSFCKVPTEHYQWPRSDSQTRLHHKMYNQVSQRKLKCMLEISQVMSYDKG